MRRGPESEPDVDQFETPEQLKQELAGEPEKETDIVEKQTQLREQLREIEEQLATAQGEKRESLENQAVEIENQIRTMDKGETAKPETIRTPEEPAETIDEKKTEIKEIEESLSHVHGKEAEELEKQALQLEEEIRESEKGEVERFIENIPTVKACEGEPSFDLMQHSRETIAATDLHRALEREDKDSSFIVLVMERIPQGVRKSYERLYKEKPKRKGLLRRLMAKVGDWLRGKRQAKAAKKLKAKGFVFPRLIPETKG